MSSQTHQRLLSEKIDHSINFSQDKLFLYSVPKGSSITVVLLFGPGFALGLISDSFAAAFTQSAE